MGVIASGRCDQFEVMETRILEDLSGPVFSDMIFVTICVYVYTF